MMKKTAPKPKDAPREPGGAGASGKPGQPSPGAVLSPEALAGEVVAAALAGEANAADGAPPEAGALVRSQAGTAASYRVAVQDRLPSWGEKLLTPSEVASLFKVDPKTVTRWAKAGKLRAVATPGGHRRFYEADVRALLAEVPAA